jgi:apolipoprotein N-acyltransferase
VARDQSLLYSVHVKQEFGNSAILLSPDGTVLNRYDKIRLVPFGEYIPLGDVLPFLQKLTPIPRSLTPGKTKVIFSLPASDDKPPTRFAALVCYETVFADLTAAFRRLGAEFFVNVTDEGWYVVPDELHQHLAMAVFRAVETRATMVRAANTGVSCFIAPTGDIYARLAPHTRGVLHATVRTCAVVTPYVRHGDVFAVACALVSVGLPLGLLVAARRRRAGEPRPEPPARPTQ